MRILRDSIGRFWTIVGASLWCAVCGVVIEPAVAGEQVESETLKLIQEQIDEESAAEREKQKIVRETDDLIMRIRRNLLDIEITISEIRYKSSNFNCLAKEEFQKILTAEISQVDAWLDEIKGRCERISEGNAEGQEICRKAIDEEQGRRAYYRSLVDEGLKRCDSPSSVSKQGGQ